MHNRTTVRQCCCGMLARQGRPQCCCIRPSPVCTGPRRRARTHPKLLCPAQGCSHHPLVQGCCCCCGWRGPQLLYRRSGHYPAAPWPQRPALLAILRWLQLWLSLLLLPLVVVWLLVLVLQVVLLGLWDGVCSLPEQQAGPLMGCAGHRTVSHCQGRALSAMLPRFHPGPACALLMGSTTRYAAANG